MFASFLKRLSADEPAPLNQNDARLALTALLVRIARTDGDYSTTEISLIRDITATRFDVSGETLDTLIGEAEILETEAPDTVRFTRAIKAAVPHEDRNAVIESLWKVVLADGQRHDHENALMRSVAGLLGISDRDSALARHKIEKGGV